MLNTMYNINSSNSKFVRNTYNSRGTLLTSTSYQIPDGNYSIITLKTWLITNFSTIFSTVYNPAQNTYTFTKTIVNTNIYIRLYLQIALNV